MAVIGDSGDGFKLIVGDIEHTGPNIMFWKFLLTMLIAPVACLLLSMIVGMVLLGLWMLLTRTEWVAKVVGVPLLLAIRGAQIYFWGFWAAFCAATAARYSVMPAVSHRWVYYVTAFISCTYILWIVTGEFGFADAVDGKEFFRIPWVPDRHVD